MDFYYQPKGMFFTENDTDVIARYRETDGKHYDDAIMRKAVEDVKKSGNFNHYNFLMNNCQDFVESVKTRYSEIVKEQRERK